MNLLGRHSSPKPTRKAKYGWIVLLFVLIAGSSYLVVNQFFAQQQTVQPKVVKKTNPKKMNTPATLETTETISTNSTQQSSEPEPQLDSTQLLASAEQVYYGVHYFNGDKDFSSNNSAPTISASVIKVFIMDYAFMQADPNEQIQDRTLNDWVVPMIQQSDNNAANVLIDYFGMDKLNDFFQAQGYQDTRLERKMLDNEARSQGQENYTSLTDCMTFLKQLYQQQGTYPQSAMLEIMQGQTIRTKIPSKLSGDVLVANKTGELDYVENDIGLVLSETNPFAIVVLTQNSKNSAETRQAIGDFALAATKIK